MDMEMWTKVDQWFGDHLIGPDDGLDRALAKNVEAGLRAINVPANMGKFLHLLARIQGARQILEIGTQGGYSTIWLGRALPSDGRLITLEINPETAAVARDNIAHAGLDRIVEVRVGRALDSLEGIASEGLPPFDLVFIDADKPNNPNYLEWALKLTRPGSVIIIDNIVRSGYVIDAEETDQNVVGARTVTKLIGSNPNLSATVLQTVGAKNYDGFLMVLVDGS